MPRAEGLTASGKTQLGDRGSDGERVSVEALAATHGPALFRFALSLTRDPTLAEDLVQETYVRALQHPPVHRSDVPVEAWLRRVLHNLAVDGARRAAHEVLVDEIEQDWQDDAFTVDAAVVVERAETRDELEDALVHVPFIYRSAVLLHDVGGLTVREIADVAEIDVPAAKQRLRRGRMALVSMLAAGARRRAALAGVPLSCWDARKRVSDVLDGAVAQDELAAIEAHLETCPTCPPLLAALVGVRNALGELRDSDSVLAPAQRERIEQRVATDVPGDRVRRSS